MSETQCEGLGSRGLEFALHGWAGCEVLAAFRPETGPEVRALGAVSCLRVPMGEAPDALDGDVVRVLVGGAAFSLPIAGVEAWASEAQTLDAVERVVFTVQGEAWELVLIEMQAAGG